jgi:predicted RNase H-like HicB family nuclease
MNKVITFTYEIQDEQTGFSVKCLDWDSVFTQAETYGELIHNTAEVTTMMLEEFIAGKLDKKQYPSIKPHVAKVNHFTLTFDLDVLKKVDTKKVKHYENYIDVKKLVIA